MREAPGGWSGVWGAQRPDRHSVPLAGQGPFIFLSYVVLSKEVRKALKFACSRKPSPDPALTTKSTLTSVRAGPGTLSVPLLPRAHVHPKGCVCPEIGASVGAGVSGEGGGL